MGGGEGAKQNWDPREGPENESLLSPPEIAISDYLASTIRENRAAKRDSFFLSAPYTGRTLLQQQSNLFLLGGGGKTPPSFGTARLLERVTEKGLLSLILFFYLESSSFFSGRKGLLLRLSLGKSGIIPPSFPFPAAILFPSSLPLEMERKLSLAISAVIDKTEDSAFAFETCLNNYLTYRFPLEIIFATLNFC